jgi:hypothetical protein
MKTHVLFLLAVSLETALMLGPALGDCTPEQVDTYLSKGLSARTIERICGDEDNTPQQHDSSAFPQGQGGVPLPQGQGGVQGQILPYPRSAFACATRVGTCPLLIQMPAGLACTCSSVWGPIPGLAQ